MMLRSPWLWVAAAFVGVMAVILVIASLVSAPPDDESRPPAPLSTATSAPVATGAPTPTAPPSGEPMDGDDGGEAVAGCQGQAPGTACDELLPPEHVDPGQVSATDRARDFVAAYVDYEPMGGTAAWRDRIAPFVAPGADLPLTAVARSKTSLAELRATAKLDAGLPVQAYPDGTDSDGNWIYTINATVVARYVDATGTVSNWSIPGTWTVTISATDGKVTAVDEDTPLLEHAP